MSIFTKDDIPVNEINDNISKLLTKTRSDTIKSLSKLAAAQTVAADEDEEAYELEVKRINLEKMFATGGGQQTQGNYIQGYSEGLLEGTKSGYKQGVKDGIEEGEQGFLLELLQKAALTVVGATAMKTILDIMGLDQYIPFLDSKIPKQGQDPSQAPGGAIPNIPGGLLPDGVSNGRLRKDQLKSAGTLYGSKDSFGGNTIYLLPAAADAFIKAKSAASKDRIQILVTSAYRSYEHQERVFRDKSSYTPAAPGTSRHGLGIALDIQDRTSGYDWFVKNGPSYGWYFMSLPGDPVHFEFRGDPGVVKNNQTTQASTSTGASSSLAMQPPGTSPEASSLAMQPPESSPEASSLAMQSPESSGSSGESLLATLFGESSSTQSLFSPPKETTSSLEIKPQSRDLGYLKDNASDVAMNESSVYIQPVIITT